MNVLKAFLLAVLLSLEGCSGILMLHQLDEGKDLSPDQIKAYNEVGMSVYGCLTVAGPPPAGSTVWIVIPKGTPITFGFSDNCHLAVR